MPLVLRHLTRGLSSKLIVPASVHLCVPLLREAQNISFKLSLLARCMRTRGTCAQAHEKEVLECGTHSLCSLQRPQRNFQAVIKLATSAASLLPKKMSKTYKAWKQDQAPRPCLASCFVSAKLLHLCSLPGTVDCVLRATAAKYCTIPI